jgi:Dolichyl-phosphate-mannose-protein mannosyltransferase
VKRLFELTLAVRLLYPFFNSPLTHLYSDPQRHWDNAANFLHPNIMGSSDPYLYQAWLFAVRWVTHDQAAGVCLGSGLLCAAMPIGWYRCLRELLPQRWAIAGALAIALLPESFSLYAYFMNETLLTTLLGFSFWLTLRAHRKGTLSAYALASAAWTCAGMTRTIALPLGCGSMLALWLLQPRKLPRVALSVVLAAVLVVPAGLHAQRNLHYFAPFGNLFSNSIYHDSGRHDIRLDYGPLGTYQFGAPSFYNPTYWPFSSWLTDRRGVMSVTIDTTHGTLDWKEQRTQARSQRQFPAWRQRWEDFQYLLFAQEWPNNDTASFMGLATLWDRWMWPPLMLIMCYAMVRGHFRGASWLLPVGALGTLILLALQTQGVTEARFREPFDELLVACVVCALYVASGGTQSRPLRPSPQLQQ